MRKTTDIRIKNKLILIIVLIGVIASLSGNLINYFYEIASAKEQLITNTRLQARLISEYCTLPLEFNYPDKATEVLQKLSTIPSITDGVLFNSKDSVFATYQQYANIRFEIPAAFPAEEYIFTDRYLLVKQLIQKNNQLEGYIVLRSVVDWHTIIVKQFLLGFSLTLLMVFIVFILATYFQRTISEPILKLAGHMKAIANVKEYPDRMYYNGKDEIGQLYDGFNLMTDRIEAREIEKKKALEELKISELHYQNLYENAPDMYISEKLTRTIV